MVKPGNTVIIADQDTGVKICCVVRSVDMFDGTERALVVEQSISRYRHPRRCYSIPVAELVPDALSDWR